MGGKTIWQQGSSSPDNTYNLRQIQQWWQELAGKEILWQQRLSNLGVEAADLSWDLQRFDETFILGQPELRGLTLYWHHPNTPQERSITASKLELSTRQELYITPVGPNQQVVIKVSLRQRVFQTITLDQPQVQVLPAAEAPVLVFQDPSQELVVRVVLTPSGWSALKSHFGVS